VSRGVSQSLIASPEGAKEAYVYIPEHFRVRDHADAIAFMQANPFAILVSTADGLPYASHIPIKIREAEDQLTIRGHFAKANPHWRHLEQQSQCLAIFHGPHSYISPSLYTNRESVPTWNYAAVHVYGSTRLFTSPDDLQGILHELMGLFEPAYAEQWASLDETYRQKMLNQIVGFEITATRVEAKFKLSQNRTREEQTNVITSLAKAEDTSVSGVARMMSDQGLGEKKDSD
jgi:transcriptional regulator